MTISPLKLLGASLLSCQFIPISENVNNRYKGHHRQTNEIRKRVKKLVFNYISFFFIYK